MSQIYLIRHGENYANLTKEFSHRRVDYSLTEKGRLQAAQTARFFQDKPIDAIYTSPLRRALETAETIAAAVDLPVTVMENFREVNVGALEDEPPTPASWRLHDEIMDAWRAGQHEVSFPSGENYLTLRTRLQQGLALLAQTHPQGRVIVVAHGGVIGVSVREFCRNVDLATMQSKENHNCSISEIEAEAHGDTLEATLIDWAYCDHLTGEAARLIPGSPDAAFFEVSDG